MRLRAFERVRVFETALLLSLCASLCAGTWAQGQQAALSRELVRLHVVAASDDAREQAVKLEVRDAVLAYLEPRLDGAASCAEARELISGSLQGVAEAAAERAGGRGVTVTLARERFPLRRYDSFTLPAGEYDSLRVTLGEGKGRNWWCVVFPPLCAPTVSAAELSETMSRDGYAVITESEGYELRFRALELWGELMEHINGEA